MHVQKNIKLCSSKCYIIVGIHTGYFPTQHYAVRLFNGVKKLSVKYERNFGTSLR